MLVASSTNCNWFSHGSSGFTVYWMMCWLAMCAVGGALESMITILTPRVIPLFLLLWIIGASSCNVCPKYWSSSLRWLTRMSIVTANVSVCNFPLQILPGIYQYGYAMPFYNVQQTVRTILFGTRDQGASCRYSTVQQSSDSIDLYSGA